MDFFEAQARAKKRTSRLLVMFALAVVGTIVAAYISALLIFHSLGMGDQQRALLGDYHSASGALVLWQPRLLVWIALGTFIVVGAASLFKWQQYSAGGGAVAEGVGGRRIDPHT